MHGDIAHPQRSHDRVGAHPREPFLVVMYRISNITMETALEEKEGSVVSGDVARSIESCICPTGYTGLSCQVNVRIIDHFPVSRSPVFLTTVL